MIEPYLDNISYPTKQEKDIEVWDISGSLKGRNQIFKFDTRPLQNISNLKAKKMSTKTKADKVVFESPRHIIIVDVEELNDYVKSNKMSQIHISKIIDSFEWNILLDKQVL